MRAGRNQNWILVAFVAGSAALAMKSNANRSAQCGPSGCNVPVSVRLMEAAAIEQFNCDTNLPWGCVVQPHGGK